MAAAWQQRPVIHKGERLFLDRWFRFAVAQSVLGGTFQNIGRLSADRQRNALRAF
jgi:hypothetical protein